MTDWAAVSDFDGTITLRDVGDHLLVHYGFCDQKTIDTSYDLQVKVEDFMRKAFAGARLSEETIAGFVREKVKARPGFAAFAAFCAKKGVYFEIVSGGIDLYARPFLEKHRLSPPCFFGRGKVTGEGVRVTYPYLKAMDLSAFKAARVRRLKKAGRKVVFFGDGPSDLKAAKAADKVYATGRLLKLCRELEIPASPLIDFHRAAAFIGRK
jgi:2-hydroxy-3-keto-5-methylthiopentenyl-1-phosphate phosphatase